MRLGKWAPACRCFVEHGTGRVDIATGVGVFASQLLRGRIRQSPSKRDGDALPHINYLPWTEEPGQAEIQNLQASIGGDH